MKFLLMTVLALSAAVIADPALLLGNGLLSSPYTSAALISPVSAPVVGPVSTYGLSPQYPLASYSAVAPVLSDYRYSYGSSYNYQDYSPVVSSALSLPYSLPYAYAADWYYRK